MGRCYSLDLRERIVDFVARGASRRSAARRFGVSESFAVKLMQHHDRHGSPVPVRQGRPPGGGKLDRPEAYLIGAVEAAPDITMPELAEKLMADHAVRATPAMLSRFLCRHGFTYKKSLAGVGMRTR